MPRKTESGIDYDDDNYYDYEEYDYDYDYEDGYDYDNEVKENGTTSKTTAKQETVKTGVWGCPICTYDNEDSMSACEICGVLRHPLVKAIAKIDAAAVGGKCKDSGASVMAKSLFASLPQHVAEKSIKLEAQNDFASTDDYLTFRKLGNIHGTFQELNCAFTSQNHHKFKIVAPFKFDAPSPDDLVSSGLQSLKLKSKGNFSRGREMVEFEFAAKGSEFSSASATRETNIGQKENDSASCSGNKPDFIGSSSKNTGSSSSKTAKGENNDDKKVAPVSKFIPEKWMFPDNKKAELSQLNIAIVGHVDSGKSTLSGRLLHLLGRISQKEMHKYEKQAKQQGKGSFAYAWALDESSEERERGITMTVGVAFCTSNKYRVVLLDSPGHRDFVPNMISGASQADTAIIVVDASIGSFETGIDAIGGQTKEHTQLIKSFGADQVIVVVNKMDVVEYSKERFDELKEKLGEFLHKCGFKSPSSILWVPASAMENQNLVANPSDERLSWFKGPHLLEAIDSLQLPARDYSKPLLMPICDVLKSQSQGQVSVCGKLENGAIRSGLKVLVMPSREIATARTLERDSQPCDIARAGDNVTVNLLGIESNRVTAGGVICHPDYPVQVANHLELKILLLDVVPAPIMKGTELEFHVHHAKEVARVEKMSLLDKKTGEVTGKSPRFLLAKQNGIVEVVLQEPVCVEEYNKCRSMGRVLLRLSGRTVAVGIVTRIIKSDKQ